MARTGADERRGVAQIQQGWWWCMPISALVHSRSDRVGRRVHLLAASLTKVSTTKMHSSWWWAKGWDRSIEDTRQARLQVKALVWAWAWAWAQARVGDERVRDREAEFVEGGS